MIEFIQYFLEASIIIQGWMNYTKLIQYIQSHYYDVHVIKEYLCCISIHAYLANST